MGWVVDVNVCDCHVRFGSSGHYFLDLQGIYGITRVWELQLVSA